MRLTIFSLFAAVLAAPPPSEWWIYARIKIEALHGPGTNATYTEIRVPIETLYHNKTALAEVSTLYLVEGAGITCIPYVSDEGVGSHGNPFTIGWPASMRDALSKETGTHVSVLDVMSVATFSNDCMVTLKTPMANHPLAKPTVARMPQDDVDDKEDPVDVFGFLEYHVKWLSGWQVRPDHGESVSK
ncbi:hypothetical protein GQX73_g5734 [Xylaria multiplex]|uniref:Uncharacterized protein n=1 Tax=Xylaria multiplex TaxID=323545 RepID=A0A7C8ITR0_9PEZI|nr:hypothetical protein GQX73_g5734 [Xylaria multiplex]